MTNKVAETPKSSQQGTHNDGQNGTEGNYMQIDEDDKNPDNGGPMDQDDMDPDHGEQFEVSCNSAYP